jgi:hypothetical protein
MGIGNLAFGQLQELLAEAVQQAPASARIREALPEASRRRLCQRQAGGRRLEQNFFRATRAKVRILVIRRRGTLVESNCLALVLVPCVPADRGTVGSCQKTTSFLDFVANVRHVGSPSRYPRYGARMGGGILRGAVR